MSLLRGPAFDDLVGHVSTCDQCGHRSSGRMVRPFVMLDDCVADQRERGDCVRFDMHGLWWSVPLELNIHQVAAQVDHALRVMRLQAFNDDPIRTTLEQR